MIVIICDATPEIGYGHLKRCLVLAGRYRNLGLGVTFLMRGASPVVKDLLMAQGMGLVVKSDHGECRSYILEKKDRIRLVILDHYEIGSDLEKDISQVLSVLVMDDLGRSHWCDLLVDQTIGRTADAYEKKLYTPSAQALLGKDYILIDPVYTSVKTTGDRENILITFGATDPGNAASKILDILEQTQGKKRLVFHLPLSSLSPCLETLKKQIHHSKLDIRLYLDLPDLCCLYEICGIAIGAPGTSLFERIYCGLMNIAIMVAENQREVGQKIALEGAAICLGEIQTLDASRLTQALTRMIDAPVSAKKMQKRAMGLVDGRGAARIVRQTLGLISATELRRAHKKDLDILYAWQHEPGARKFSKNTDLPAKNEHQAWLDMVLSDHGIRLYIIQWCQMAIGYIRLDNKGEKDEVSILIAQRFQGHGFAKKSLQQIMAVGKKVYTAEVHPENQASIDLFDSVGFQCKGNGEYAFNPLGTRLYGD